MVDASSTVTEEGFSDSSSFSTPSHDASETLPSVHDTTNLDIDIFDQLEEAITEAEKHQKQAFDKSVRRQRAEEEPILFRPKEALAKANGFIELMKREMDALKQDRDDIIDKLVKMSEQKATLEQRVDEYGGTVRDLEDRLAASKSLIHSQQLEYEKLKHERDNALKDADDLRKEKDKIVSYSSLAWNTEFLKIGEGGFGRVYRGFLRNTTVAIKMLRSHNLQGQSQFRQELVTLMGSCSEASGLVYEFLPNGSLEGRLACENDTPPLTWQVRTRIIGEICSALVFLHSNKPHPVIHGDLKPANILLDANFVSKLSTFAYMDPEFLTTGELTARSDVYSLGIVILQLVTGKPALGIGRAVEDALDNDERRRPYRVRDVWCVIEPLVKSASLSAAPQSFGHRFVESHTPSCFEVMRNPHIAADGYTYESEVIKGWLHSGRNTSPMTKLPLAHHHLIPNRALHSVIQEHLKQHQKPPS
ncbi:hypothetical protein HU200_018615 [Digitaria exilis]|uniref:RING-type E3 ubiquitin transferase n=1 Tax=Digitaria exilis TaxID=1010633 RepID=A0A835F4S4_9POAL|nr:hypothetical protein HU200_018615 [Digitaria exilis]